ncbi:MAG: hypothetical protein AB7I18_14980, partial [Candidatus Berkiella sp.]
MPFLQPWLGDWFSSKIPCREAVGKGYKLNLKKEKKMKKMAKVWISASLVGALSASAWSGQSVTSDLDKCINQKKVSYTAKGAVAGALMGFLSAKASGK